MLNRPNITRALFLAAGQGARLGSWTDSHPKALLPIAGTPMLVRALESLAAVGIQQVIIVVGHHGTEIRSVLGDRWKGVDVIYVSSANYETTNNSYSLWLAREYLDSDLLLLEADVVFDHRILLQLFDEDVQGLAAAVSPFRTSMSGTVVSLDERGFIRRMYDTSLQGSAFDYANVYKTLNIYRLTKEYLTTQFVPRLDDLICQGRIGEYYEIVFRDLIAEQASEFRAVICDPHQWCEVDDPNDEARANYVFADANTKLRILEDQHGGFWRFGVTDHALLYNVHYPSAGLKERISSELDNALCTYPSGQATLSTLLENTLHLPSCCVSVANGASELIRSLAGYLGKHVVIPVPSFNEYASAIESTALVRFQLHPPEFDLDVVALAETAERCRATTVVVVSPNNPTSKGVKREQLIYLGERLRGHGCKLLLDESFVDFCSNPAISSLEDVVNLLPNLIIIKSLSKVCGIAGLRLGYMLTSDQSLSRLVRNSLPIWNINGVAESFLRHHASFRDAFRESCKLVRADTDVLFEALSACQGLTVLRPDANFVLVRLPPGVNATSVVKRLLGQYDIYTKHCAGKDMADAELYLRVASRTSTENRYFVEALQTVVN